MQIGIGVDLRYSRLVDRTVRVSTSVLSGQSGYTVRNDYHMGAIRIKVDSTAPKFFLAIRDTGTQKYGVWCDGTNIYTGWVDNGVIRTTISTTTKPTGDFYVEVHIPQFYKPGYFDNLLGYIRGFVWSASGSKPGSFNIGGQMQSPTTTWASSTPKSSGNLIIPTSANQNGFYYKCTTAGTTGTTEPTWANATTEGATITDNTVTWTAYKIVPQLNTGLVSLYSYDGTQAKIKDIFVGDGYNAVNPYRNQAYYVGRWFNTMSWSNVGLPLGEEFSTFNQGSEILAQFSNTTTLTLNYGNSDQFVLAVSIDGAPLTRLAICPQASVSGSTYPTNTITLATGLNPNVTHTVRMVVAAINTSHDKWNYIVASFRFKGFSGDNSNFTFSPWYPNKRKILFIGDSITDGDLIYQNTAGGGNDASNNGAEVSYPKVASDLLNSIGYQHGFGSVGITVSGLEGVPVALDATRYWYNTKNEMYEEPDIIVIAHHVNGSASTDTDFTNGYNTLINWFITKWGSSKPIFLIEVSPYGTKRLLLPTIASGFSNVTFIGTTQAGLTVTTTNDGIHPDANGHSVIANQLATQLKSRFGKSFFGL